MSDPKFENSVASALERNKLFRRNEVKALTKIGDTKRNRLIKAGKFPKPVKHIGENDIPGRTSFWTHGDILDYLEARVAERNKRIAEVATEGLNGWLNQIIKKNGEPSHE